MKIKPPKGPQRVQLGDVPVGKMFVYWAERTENNVVYMKVHGDMIAVAVTGSREGAQQGYNPDNQVYPVDILDSRWEFTKS